MRSTPTGSCNWIALDVELDRQPGLASLLHELADVLEARLGGERRRLLGPPEHADHPAHLRQRLAPGLLDDEECLPLALLLGPEEPAHRRGLHGHDADAVADDVMELSRDPRALLADCGPCSFLALTLGAAARSFASSAS